MNYVIMNRWAVHKDHLYRLELLDELVKFVGWVNDNSDGWPYWKPAQARHRPPVEGLHVLRHHPRSDDRCP